MTVDRERCADGSGVYMCMGRRGGGHFCTLAVHGQLSVENVVPQR